MERPWHGEQFGIADLRAVDLEIDLLRVRRAIFGGAIEGFWIARPWSSGETCPAEVAPPAAPGTETITLPGQTLAIAQVFSSDGPRTGRRDDQPYVTVLRVPPEALRTARGFRIRLSGRLAAVPGGDGVRCRQPGGPEQRPICLVATRIDDISVDNGATGEALAHWGDKAANVRLTPK